jgi:hypothetical protein
MNSDVDIRTLPISERFRYRNDFFQSDVFFSDIGITDVDVGCRISPNIEIDVDAHLWLSVNRQTKANTVDS